MFRYKTRGNSSPNGKPTVFYFGHQDDFQTLFERVSNELLEECNCAIFYSDDDQFQLQQLDQINLFVISVTDKLLDENKNILESLLKYADKNNIPILPLMMQNVSRTKYSELFGRIQYLNEYQSDVTAIPYKEKLHSFLRAVLFDNDISEKVRKVFSAYIFLSYRKKDREHAQKLMRLIHENDFAQDYAIWYDEFLTPGENYNEDIEEALNKSSLIAMVVTPNLVVDGNYIIRIEYPLAVKLGKTVAPIEMVPTDTNELKRLFYGISDIVDGSDKDALAQIIKKSICDKKEEIYDPLYHDYYLGLAYLLGIDVERDTDKAIKLITSSAEEGLDEACKKLSDMYFYGDGVPRDYDLALIWMKKVSEKYRELAIENCSDEAIYVYLGYESEYGEKALLCEKYSEAEDAYNIVYEAANILAYGSVSNNPFRKTFDTIRKMLFYNEYLGESLFYMIHSQRMLLYLYSQMGIVDSASKCGIKATNLVKASSFVLDSPVVREEMISIYNKMLTLCLESGSIDRANQWLNKLIEIGGSTSAKDDKYLRAIVLEQKGREAEQLCDYAEAYQNIESAKCLFIELFDEFKNIEYAIKILDCYTLSIHIYDSQKDISKGLSCIEEAEGFLHENEKAFDKMTYNRYYAELALCKGKILFDNNTDESEKYIKEAYDFFDSISTETVNATITIPLIQAFLLMAKIKAGKMDYLEAEEIYEKAETFIMDTASFTKAIHYVRIAALVHEEVMMFYAGIGQGALASRSYDFALYFRKLIYDSTKIEEDRLLLEKHKKNKSSVRAVYNVPDGVEYLEEYIRKSIKEKGLKTELSKKVEMEIGKLALDFWHRDRDPSRVEHFYQLGKELTNENKPADKGVLFYRSGKITEFILKYYYPFYKYSEEVNLIFLYCSYTDLYLAKRVYGGRKEALDDYEEFCHKMPMLLYPMSKIKYPELWVEIVRYNGGRI